MNETLDTLLRITVERHASDLHLTSGVPPMLRIHGRLEPLDGYKVLMPADLEGLIRPILNEGLLRTFEQQGQVDLSHGVPGVGRFRCNVFRQRGSWGMAARVIPAEVPSLDQLGLPPVVADLCGRVDGLILVTGPTGSGKSTTLAAMIDHINQHRKTVIITLEDPIEYLHRHKMSVINQREIGTDTTSFAAALRGALRADPDVVLVGEMRDLDTVATALRAAETGHLVLSTLHTRGAAETVERVIDMFPPEQQRQIQLQFASTIQAVISQRLLPRADGQGRVLACEVMVATPAIRTMIRESKWHQIPAAIETGARFGMRTLEASMRALLERGLIDPEEMLALKRE
ncbi:type IV pilus twitching motility protein PilT [Carboxydochorda subterranea]|uniref:Type IV pilus twitching motility protein PilT n=1 Tax=Carboxydichorda subterranea TaxID=3109565 RepID=A0ABZ1BUZ5_9FIRM|nr:type IV pilus twitching motility protein PilT [Limnochorda sp. L945t]WRP16351.1 type IV pilus twitching motility protein PilT [Limnochorda sp. L945t]